MRQEGLRKRSGGAHCQIKPGQFIARTSDDGYVAASDSRRDGQAVGF